MAVISGVGIALFIWRELTVDHPAVDLRVLRHRSMIGGSIYSAILGMGIYGIMFAIPVFVQDYLHYTATQSGLLAGAGRDRLGGDDDRSTASCRNRFDPRRAHRHRRAADHRHRRAAHGAQPRHGRRKRSSGR